jgi:hypothetical protein
MQRKTMIEVYKTTYKLSNKCTKGGTAGEGDMTAWRVMAGYAWLEVMRT